MKSLWAVRSKGAIPLISGGKAGETEARRGSYRVPDPGSQKGQRVGFRVSTGSMTAFCHGPHTHTGRRWRNQRWAVNASTVWSGRVHSVASGGGWEHAIGRTVPSTYS